MDTGILIGAVVTLVLGVFAILAALAYLAHRRQSTVSAGVVGAGLAALVITAAWLVIKSGRWFELPPEFLPWLTAVAYLSIGAFLLVVLDSLIIGEYLIAKRGRYIPDVVRTLMVSAGTVAIALVILRVTVGINVIALVALPTVATAVIGVALKDTLARFFAGVALGKMVKEGDWIATLDKEGKVTRIGMEHLTLLTRDQDQVILPNDNVIQVGLINYSRPSTVHVCSVDVEASYDASPQYVQSVLVEAAIAVEGVLANPPPKALAWEFRECGILYRLRFSIGDYMGHMLIKSQVRAYVWNAFQRHGILIPFPQRVIHHTAPADKKSDSRHTSVQLAERLHSVDLFASLSPERLTSLAEHSSIQSYLPGERIVRQGEPGNGLYVVLDGRADVYVQHDSLQAKVSALERGQCFGEMSLLTGAPRSATVTAAGHMTVLMVGQEAIKNLLEDDRSLIEEMGAIVARRHPVTQAARDSLTREQAALMLASQQRTLVERIQNYLWGQAKR